MLDLTPYSGSIWLAEESRLRRIAANVLAYGNKCFSREQVMAQHRADLERAKALADDAPASCGSSIPAHLKKFAETITHQANGDGSITIGPAKADAPTKAIRAVPSGKKVGVIPIWGPVEQRLSSALMKAGGTSLDFVSRAFSILMDDPSIGTVVLHMDTPGGESFGVMELADKIYNARGTKPIYAMADSMAASAGMWIASAADMIICTPGGLVGSVGVYVMHTDASKALEDEGVKITLISAGKYKTELAPFGPLSEDAKANQQAYVDALYTSFVGALARNRGTSVDDVRKNYGQGRVMMAEDALKAGVVDRVLPYETLLAKLTGGEPSKVQRGPSMDVLRLRHELESEDA